MLDKVESSAITLKSLMENLIYCAVVALKYKK